MNIDLNALSSAVQQVVVTKNTTKDVKLVGGDLTDAAVPVPTAPTRRASRRRSSIGPCTAKQFVEAAHQSWTFAKEDLPSGDTALQRRKSKRSSGGAETTKQAKVGHRNFTIEEEEAVVQKPKVLVDECSPLLKTGSSKMLPPRTRTQPELKRAPQPQKKTSSSSSKELPPRNKTHPRPRRASMSGGFAVAPAPAAAQPAPDLDYGMDDDSSPKAARKFSRRSSLVGVSVNSNLDNSNGTTSSDPGPSPSPPMASPPAGRRKMARRNTIHAGSNNDEDQEFPSSLRRTSSKNSQGIIKGQVRFELDHKNRIKRRVSYIRKQTSRTDAKFLWWSEADLERIYERENRVYDKFSNDRRYKRAIRKMWGNCSKAASVPLSPEAIAHVTGAPSRGLEVDILEVVRDRRLRVIANLLDAQETLRDFDPTIRAKVLGARYKNLCKAASRFAQKMGEGDALEAANVYSN